MMNLSSMKWVATFVISRIASRSFSLLQINRTVYYMWFIFIFLLISTEVRSESLRIISFLYYIADSFFYGFVNVEGVFFFNCFYILIFDLMNFYLLCRLFNKDSINMNGTVRSGSWPISFSRLSLWFRWNFLSLAIFLGRGLVFFLNTDLVWIGVLMHYCLHRLLVKSWLARTDCARCYDFKHGLICSSFLRTFLCYGLGNCAGLQYLSLWLLNLPYLCLLW